MDRPKTTTRILVIHYSASLVLVLSRRQLKLRTPETRHVMPSTNMLNNKYPENMPNEFHQRSGNNASMSLTGQDQETGEIVTYPNLKARTAPGEHTQSIVDSEGWDELPEEILFAAKSNSKCVWISNLVRREVL